MKVETCWERRRQALTVLYEEQHQGAGGRGQRWQKQRVGLQGGGGRVPGAPGLAGRARREVEELRVGMRARV